jgi:hypothetical protein
MMTTNGGLRIFISECSLVIKAGHHGGWLLHRNFSIATSFPWKEETGSAVFSNLIEFPSERRTQVVPASMPRRRFKKGKLFAEIIEDRRPPPVFFWVVQKQCSSGILFLGQTWSRSEAESAANQFIDDYLGGQRKSRGKSAPWPGYVVRLDAKGALMRLRLESVGGSLVNDYRISDGVVQVRSLDTTGRPVSGPLGSWRVVDETDISLHYALGTAVSQWLRVRLGTVRSALKSAA